MCQVNLSDWQLCYLTSGFAVIWQQILSIVKRLNYIGNLDFGHAPVFSESAGCFGARRTIRFAPNCLTHRTYGSKAGWVTRSVESYRSGADRCSEMHRSAIVTDKQITCLQDWCQLREACFTGDIVCLCLHQCLNFGDYRDFVFYTDK